MANNIVIRKSAEELYKDGVLAEIFNDVCIEANTLISPRKLQTVEEMLGAIRHGRDDHDQCVANASSSAYISLTHVIGQVMTRRTGREYSIS